MLLFIGERKNMLELGPKFEESNLYVKFGRNPVMDPG